MAKLYFKMLSNLIQQMELDLGRNPNVKIEIKHFFSGAALYVDGKICISLTPVGLALKLPENKKNTLIQEKKAKSLQYFPRGPIKKDYVVLSEPLIKNLIELAYWVNLCVDYVTKKDF